MTAIVMYDIPGVVFDQPLNIPAAFLCIGVWAAPGSLAGRTTQPGRYVNAQSGAAEAERPGAGLRLRAVPLWS